jgi:hypothetical protein
VCVDKLMVNRECIQKRINWFRGVGYRLSVFAKQEINHLPDIGSYMVLYTTTIFILCGLTGQYGS